MIINPLIAIINNQADLLKKKYLYLEYQHLQ
jgi:hypothetical protein